MRIWLSAAVFSLPMLAMAQSACSSDGQAAPTGLMERFISADCADCWASAQSPRPGQQTLALDWIVPGSQGEDAPLSAAARRDSLYRLQALNRAAPVQADSITQPVQANPQAPPGRQRLRVGHGLPLNNYVGTSIQVRAAQAKTKMAPTASPASAAPGGLTRWLVLVETVPAGTEGTPVERNLVRNSYQSTATSADVEYVPMQIPEGANPDRLRVVGWLEDAQGRVHGAAASRCVAN
jgi:hypothetical protein